MKKFLRKALSLMLSAVLVSTTLSAFSLSVSAAAVTKAGPKADYSFNAATGTLTITGTGEMYDFANTNLGSNHKAPWESNKPNIRNIVVGEGITTIGEYSFYNCTALTSVSLPSTLKSIHGSGTVSGKLTSLGAFRECTSLESIVLPEGLTEIQTVAFLGCTSLKSVTFPDSLTTLGRAAFCDCTNLSTVTFGSGLTSTGLETFYRSGVRRVNWNESITEIGSWSFFNTKLASIDLPDHITSVGLRAFADSYFLTDAYIHNRNTSFSGDPFSNTDDSKNQNLTIHGHAGSTAQTFATEKGYAFLSLDECAHTTYHTQVTLEPTCENTGTRVNICNDCNEIILTTTLEATGHNYIELTRQDRTQENGHIYITSQCSKCDNIKTDVVHQRIAGSEDNGDSDDESLRDIFDGVVGDISSLATTPSYVWIDGYYTYTNSSTCTKAGVATYTCTVDGCERRELLYAPSGNHEVNNWRTSLAPTCTNSGKETGTCTKCNEVVTRDIEPTGHRYNPETPNNTVDNTAIDGHIINYYTCSVCSTNIIKKVHVDWVDGYYTPDVFRQPSCNLEGLEKDTCDVCGETRTFILEKYGEHIWQVSEITEPTCTTRKKITYVCANCGNNYSEYEDALGHDYVKNEELSEPATCTESGFDFMECSRCSATKPVTLPAKGHQAILGTYVVTQQPTCEGTGMAMGTCDVCGEDYTLTLAELGHDFEETTREINDSPGHIMVTPVCTRCSTTATSEVRHEEWLDDYIETDVVAEANCVTGMVCRDTCTICNQKRTYTEGEPLGHKYKYARVIGDAIGYSCEYCVSVTAKSLADVTAMWDNKYYNMVLTDVRIVTDDSVYLDVNGDGIINAKDYAKMFDLYRKAQQSETDEDSDNTDHQDSASTNQPEETNQNTYSTTN